MYRLEIDGRAQKDLNRLQRETFRRVVDALAALRKNPRSQGSTKMRMSKDAYRLRVGDHRILCDVDDAARTIVVWRVKHRREAYRDL